VSILSEVAFLNRKQQVVIREARAKNVQFLKNLLLQGQQDGSIRRCDLDVVCQAVFGVLSWAPLSRLWTRHDDAEFAARMAAAIPDMILNGVVAAKVQLPETHLRIADALTDAQQTEREQRLESLARVGSMLFNRRGIDGISLDDVALEMGATKGVLYHYFKSKSDFVAYCYNRAFDIYERIMAVAESCPTGLEATMVALELDVEAQLTDIYPLWLQTGFRGLPAKMQAQLLKRSQLLAARSVALAQRGVADGSLHRFDIEPVKLAAPGSFTYLSTWLPPADERRAAQIAQEVSRFLLLGLRPR
jgi:AcrR family transcriptional regulator